MECNLRRAPLHTTGRWASIEQSADTVTAYAPNPHHANRSHAGADLDVRALGRQRPAKKVAQTTQLQRGVFDPFQHSHLDAHCRLLRRENLLFLGEGIDAFALRFGRRFLHVHPEQAWQRKRTHTPLVHRPRDNEVQRRRNLPAIHKGKAQAIQPRLQHQKSVWTGS